MASNDVKQPLYQGNGATSWAEPEAQSRHKCIVVAPEYPVITVDDNYIVRGRYLLDHAARTAVELWRKDGNHRATWFVAYGIKSVQDWLFEQHK